MISAKITGLALCIAFASAFTVAHAQSSLATGRIAGTTLDPSGAAVPGARLIAKNQATGTTSSSSTDSTGHFEFLNLDPGTYDVNVSAEGFAATTLTNIRVSVGTTTNLRPHLGVGSVDTSVNVSGDAPLIDPEQSALSSVVNERAIDSLPLNGRNFTDFVLLTPGVSTDGDFGMVSFNGLAGNYNNYTVDGSNDNNAFFEQQIGRTSIPFQFSEDVIQEFQVISNGFNAEFGQAGGGVVNTVTKGGTNQLHGDAYYYITDSMFNANDAINKQEGIAKPANRRQQFGATIGGPVIKNRLFWIANYESQVRNEPLTVNEGPLALDQLPAGFLTSNPEVSTLVNATAGSHARSFNQNTGFVKLSGILTPKNSFDLSYNYQRFRSPHGYFNTPTSTGDGLTLTDGATSHFAQFTLRSQISATTLNEFRFHFGSDLHFDLPDSAPTFPAVIIQDPDKGVVLGGNRFQLSTTDQRFEIANTISKIVGRHTIKAGVDVNLNRDRDYFIYGPHGAYFFSSLADVASANFEYYLQSFGQSTARIFSPTYALFGQDQFRATDRLTLNYGLRWDMQQLPQPNPCNPDFPMTCHINYGKHNLAPRAGFAYALGKQNSTVVRGAFGLFYSMEDLLDVSQAEISNGILRQFLFVPGPAFGNSSPLVAYPNALSSFPSGTGGTPSLVVFSPRFRSPYVEQANVEVEHQFGANTALSVGYVYTHGISLLGNSNGVTRQANGNFGLDINLVPPDQQIANGGAFASDTIMLPGGKSYTVPDYEAIDGELNPNYGTINEIDNSGTSVYHALRVSFRHTSKQFQGGVSYTLSKNTDVGTGYYNQFDIPAQRGPSLLDQRNRLVLTGSWMPKFSFARGFTLSSVATFASGRPFEPELDNSNINFKMVPGEAFNSFTGPGVNDVDARLAREIRMSERLSLRLTAEAFDLFNHPNYQQSPVNQVQFNTAPDPSQPNAGNAFVAIPNPDFGKALAVAPRYGSRSLQFSARFSF